nr:MAG TPA: putative transcriptional regulator [Caudoviricetes sp.]
MSLAEILRSYKRKKGVTNQWIADAANVSRGTVDRLLAGGSKAPRYDTLCNVAAALECPMAELGDVYVAPPEPFPDPCADATEADDDGQDGRFYAMICNYEDRLSAMTALYEARLTSQERAHTEYAASITLSYESRLRYMRKMLIIAGVICVVLLVGVVAFTIVDLLSGQVGWIRDANYAGHAANLVHAIHA